MATSLKRKGLPSPTRSRNGRSLIDREDEEFSNEETVRQTYEKEDKKVKKSIAKAAALHQTHDAYSLSHLAKILVNGERNEVLNAVDRLKGRSRVLFELACFSGYPYVRLSAVSHLSGDTEALADIVKYCQHSDTRAAALDEMATNNEGLVEAACSSLYKDSRMDAVMLLANPKALVQVASRSPNSDSRLAALEKIAFDTGAIEKVAEESPYRSVRMEATKRLGSNLVALSMLLLRAKRPEVRKLAAMMLAQHVEIIDDINVLIELAKSCADQDARYLAVGKLWRHPNALHRVSIESEHKDAKTTAMMLLSDMVENLEDTETLVEVASASPYEDCRAAAVDRLVGMSTALLSIATKSKYKDTRYKALNKLKGDLEAMKNVIKRSKYKDTRGHAYRIVSEPKMFQSHLEKILG